MNELKCGDCGGDIRARVVRYRQPNGEFIVTEHWQCLAEVGEMKRLRTYNNPTHRVRVEIGREVP